MPVPNRHPGDPLKGHALRNAHLRERALRRAETAPPLARILVTIRAQVLSLTRLELARRSGISRGTLRDLELGIHTPTRRILQKFLAFCQRCGVSAEHLEELRRLYTGSGDTLEQFIARLELLAGSSRELARRVGISAATLWEYRRGNFPLPLALLRQMCAAVDADAAPGEILWREAERQRLRQRGYPEALAEFWVLCAGAGYTEKNLLALGMSTAAVRRLRYLELPAWREVVAVVEPLCPREQLLTLERLWCRAENGQPAHRPDEFGARLQQLRKQHGIQRRELADLFGIGGKKPARIIKYIEEDGFYSAQAYPAGLAALLTADHAERAALLDTWQERRGQFHRRHRPETRFDLRLARELYGLELREMEPILGYSSLEYQKIERGVQPLADTARERILRALHQAGQRRVEVLLEHRIQRDAQRSAWQSPPSVPALITLLAQREGGLIPLSRYLKKAGLKGLWTARLRAISHGEETPPWCVLKQIARVCDVAELADVHHDWRQRYHTYLAARYPSPLGVELRLLIGEVAESLRDFSPRLGFNYSVLVRDLQKIDRDDFVKWFHVERIARAAGLPAEDERWREMHGLWRTASDRKKQPTPSRRWASSAARRD
ncbi:MAG TPA: helix-turn-helix transcriptional regulator [Gemmataceae bacterium]|nr:helix-turn-helix transcriptional regulator [Gemmataceae bacterium]